MTEPLLDLTVVVPSYNTRELLQNCLESVYRHTDGITFEVICVDGNSPDGSADMVAGIFPDVILIRNAVNESYAKSANQGIRKSRGRYACLLDSDTVLTGNAFAALVQFMEEHPEAAACGPKLLNPDGTVQHDIRRFAGLGVFFLQTLNWHKVFPKSRLMSRYYASDFDFSRAQPVEAIGTTVFVLRRSTWETAGLLDERFRWAMPDLAYEYMLGQKGYKLYYTPCAQVVHYGSQDRQPGCAQDPSRTMPGFYRFQRCLRLLWQELVYQVHCSLRYSFPLLLESPGILRELRQAGNQGPGPSPERNGHGVHPGARSAHARSTIEKKQPVLRCLSPDQK